MSAPKVGDHEYEVRPLAVEVPYLYAQAVGLAIFGTDWFTLFKGKGDKAGAVLTTQRTIPAHVCEVSAA